MRLHVRIRVWNRIAAEDLISRVLEIESEGELHELAAVREVVHIVDFFAVLGLLVADVLAGLVPASAFFVAGAAGEKAGLHAVFV